MTDFFTSLDRAVQRVQEGLDAVRDVIEVVADVTAPVPSVIDAEHLRAQREWSEKTFGPGPRTEGILKHIAKELDEIRESPSDLEEWIDIVILGLDGAWRSGGDPQEIIDMLVYKQAKNEGRTWPDWRTRSEDEAIEHVRD